MLLLARFCFGLAFIVILLGAYTRLKEAGLGCPDWPGCYGDLIPSTTIEPEKAWIEMIHRYFAGTLGICILILTTLIVQRAKQLHISKSLAISLLLVVIFQACLGMWTVTLKLLPIVVMLHLLGGFTCLTLIWWINLRLTPSFNRKKNLHLSLYPSITLIAMFALSFQIVLGGWTSANYAALVCTSFPECSYSFWPHFDWEAFNLIGASALEKPVDFMSYSARVTIHMFHRTGAALNVLLLSFLSYQLWPSFKRNVSVLLSLLTVQLLLGVANIIYKLPLWVAVSHNGVAALLWICLFTLWHKQHLLIKQGQVYV